MEFLIGVVVIAFVFEFINGFHDAANAIATVVSTRVLTPRAAVLLAAVFNFIGALSGEAVARTIGVGLVETSSVSTSVILCAMLAGIFWNLLTWWWGLPSSSSHALIGGLCGATLAAASRDWSIILWSVERFDPRSGSVVFDGVFHTVVIPMISSPLAGLLGAFLFMSLLNVVAHRWRPARTQTIFERLQLASASFMAWGHGFADAQKTMGIIALATFTATQAGKLEQLPPLLGFLYTPTFGIALWVKISCAVVMAAGTWAGGWRIIRTLGYRLVPMKPIHGFAAETAGASVLMVAGGLGLPVSTTHCLTSAIVGVGLAKSPRGFAWQVAHRILAVWLVTIPVTAAVGYGLFILLRALRVT